MSLSELYKESYYKTKKGFLLHGDTIEWMRKIPEKSVHLILADLPYGTTACSWDSIIPFDQLWEQYERIITETGAIVLTASQPFTGALVMSKPELFKYSWVWVKNRPTNFAHAKNKPMKKHEDILVFSKGTTVHATQSKTRMTYNPQGLVDTNSNKTFVKKKSELTDAFFQERKSHGEFKREKTGYPHTILEFSTDQLGLHPTAKPLKLFEYLILTYSNENEIVLDNTSGSGTTAVAAENTKRRWICIEQEKKYCEATKERLENIHKEIQ